jgi:hypothetical protein
VGFIYSAFGFLAPTTMGGYNLIQHTGVFFEYLPDEYAPIRDTYLRYRDIRIAERGDQTNTIWEAIPELTKVSGLGFYDLSRELQRLSLLLIRQHPDLYLRNVAEGWVSFWKAPVYWDPALVSSPILASVLRLWAVAGRAVTLAVNAAFLGLSLFLILRFRRYHDLFGERAWLAPWGFVWFTSVVQTIVDHGDNPRFLVPLQAVVFFCVALAAAHILGNSTKKRNPRRPKSLIIALPASIVAGLLPGQTETASQRGLAPLTLAGHLFGGHPVTLLVSPAGATVDLLACRWCVGVAPDRRAGPGSNSARLRL